MDLPNHCHTPTEDHLEFTKAGIYLHTFGCLPMKVTLTEALAWEQGNLTTKNTASHATGFELHAPKYAHLAQQDGKEVMPNVSPISGDHIAQPLQDTQNISASEMAEIIGPVAASLETAAKPSMTHSSPMEGISGTTDNYPKVTQKITTLIDKLEARLFHMPLARELCLLAREGLAARAQAEPPRFAKWDPQQKLWIKATAQSPFIPSTLRKTL